MKKNKDKNIKYSKEEIKIMKEKNKVINLFTGVITGMFTCINVYLIYNILKLSGVENLLRYAIIGILSIICILILRKYLKLRKQPKKRKYIIFILLLLIFGSAEFYISSIIDKGVGTIDKINKDEITYTSALISMKNGKYTDLKNINNAKIGIISDKNDVEGYVLAQKLIKDNKIKKDKLEEYDDYITMLTDLYSDEINAAFVSGSYVDKFSTIEKFQNIKDEVKVLDKHSKRMKKVVDKDTGRSNKKVTEPFSILLLGVDSETEDISKTSGLGDSIMLVTFNPNTLNATIFSIPRDTFVPISCYRNAKSKITHAASGGDSCMIKTVENFTGINIDYYAKINFRGLMNLVNAMDGIDVEVPYAFCETTMWRSQEFMVYVDKGMQHLNGEQALALSRNRKTYPACGKKWNQGTRNDFVRGQNQQIVIKGIMNKAKSIKSINKVYEILDAISISLDTNLTRDQILDFYNVFKKVLINSDSLSDSNDLISMQKTYLNGSGGLMYDNIMNMDLYEFVPSNESLKAIVKAMKINLELEEEKPIKKFSFTIDEPYKQKVIGSDLYGGVEKQTTSSSTKSNKGKTCDTGEELGADQTTCVCKYRYSRNSAGTCVKKEETKKTCGSNEELGADQTTCVCKYGYSRNSSTGTCEKKEEQSQKNNTTENTDDTKKDEGDNKTDSDNTGGSEDTDDPKNNPSVPTE